MPQSFKVIVVGGGPAGISTAVECIEAGMKPEDVVIFEKGPNPIEAIRKFYPEKKMTLANYKGLPTVTEGHLPCFPDLTKLQTIEYFDDLIKKYRLQMRLKSDVYKVVSTGGELKAMVGHDEYVADVLSIGIGILGRPNKPEFKVASSLRDQVLYDITSQKIEKKKILIVGGGDTSSEYAQVLADEGNEITFICRSKDLSRMMETNQKNLLALEQKAKVKIYFGTELVGIEEVSGNPKVLFKEAKPAESEVFEKVIFAIGGTTPINFLRVAGVDCDNNWPKYSESGATNVERLYLTGDLVAGKTGGSIITAYNSSYRSVKDFLKYIK